MKKVCLRSVVVCAAVFVCAISVAAVRSLPPGSAAPNFTLKDVNGQDHTLSKLKGSIVVLDFSSINCPYSKGVDLDLVNLPAQYAGKDVVFLGVNANNDTTAEQIKQYIEVKKLPFPTLKDADNNYADAIGATRTPEFYVLDKSLKIAYHGAYDNRKAPDKVGDINYVKDAVDALLAGNPVKTAEMDAWGCTIKRVQK